MTSQAIEDIKEERARQKNVKGWTPEHDDTHVAGELAAAAACYAVPEHFRGDSLTGFLAQAWPWNWAHWKSTNRRRDLVKAGALIVAEIERLDRFVAPKDAKNEGGNAVVAHISRLRAANAARQAEWDSFDKIDLAYRGNELAGEVGETLERAVQLLNLSVLAGKASNLIKKIQRQTMGLVGSQASVDDLGDELADVVICADLIAMDAGIDLGKAVGRKFNKTSAKNDLMTRMTEGGGVVL